MKHAILIAMILLVLQFARSKGQTHDHHHHGDTTETHETTMTTHTMTSATSLSLPMTRNGSGTGWQPDASPMYAYMEHDVAGWQLMLQGSLFLRSTWTNVNNFGMRSDSHIDAPNFIMAMVQRQVGANGLLGFQMMMSFDALTVGGAGYPLLFQTGESWQGRPLIDHQHPHDLFSALAILYTQRFSNIVDVTAYVGYPGEPALGPTVFMHRASSIANPDAPLGHHWLDATHIVFGVGTVGVRYDKLKVEGSIFTGREPDENRYNFDKPLFDSYSWRVSWSASRNVVAQVSQGYLHQPEFGSTDDIVRTTASVQWASDSSHNRWSGILAAGHNNSGDDHQELALLAEAAVDMQGTIPYFRMEWVQKSLDELGIQTVEDDHTIESIGAISIGLSQRLLTVVGADVSVGGQLTAHVISSTLNQTYGNAPLSGQIYVRLTPRLF